MSASFELNEKVVIKDTSKYPNSHTGVISSIIYKGAEPQFGVDLDADHYDPTPHYFAAEELRRRS